MSAASGGKSRCCFRLLPERRIFLYAGCQPVPCNAVNTWSIKRLVSVWPSFVSVLRSASAVLELWAAYVSCGAANLDDSYYYGGDRAHRAPPPNGPGTPQTGAAPSAAATP